jgi:hypothetical protein
MEFSPYVKIDILKFPKILLRDYQYSDIAHTTHYYHIVKMIVFDYHTLLVKHDHASTHRNLNSVHIRYHLR